MCGNHAGVQQDGDKTEDKQLTEYEANEEMQAPDDQFICRVCDPVHEDLDDDEAEEEAEVQRPLRDPGAPTKQEIAEHNLTHIPPRPWCPHCLRGKGKDSPSLKLSGPWAESLVPRVRLDYCFLTETADGEIRASNDIEDDDTHESEAENKQTMLVLQESECHSVWSYAVDKKGATE